MIDKLDIVNKNRELKAKLEKAEAEVAMLKESVKQLVGTLVLWRESSYGIGGFERKMTDMVIRQAQTVWNKYESEANT